MDNNPVDPIRRLGERLREVAESVGLEMHTFAVVPDLTGGESHGNQAMFSLVPEKVAVSEEQAAVDEQFAEIARHEVKDKEQEKADAAREKMLAMRERLAKGLPLLPDEDAGE